MSDSPPPVIRRLRYTPWGYQCRDCGEELFGNGHCGCTRPAPAKVKEKAMAKEILAVPEEHLADVINVIRTGLSACAEDVDPAVIHNLSTWCDEEEEYLDQLEPDAEGGPDE